MSTDNLNESEAFYTFLGQRLEMGSCDQSPEELLHSWRTMSEHGQAVRAIQECIPDMEAGHGIPLKQAAAEIRSELGFGDSE